MLFFPRNQGGTLSLTYGHMMENPVSYKGYQVWTNKNSFRQPLSFEFILNFFVRTKVHIMFMFFFNSVVWNRSLLSTVPAISSILQIMGLNAIHEIFLLLSKRHVKPGKEEKEKKKIYILPFTKLFLQHCFRLRVEAWCKAILN